jgi:hypothetical protein
MAPGQVRTDSYRAIIGASIDPGPERLAGGVTSKHNAAPAHELAGGVRLRRIGHNAGCANRGFPPPQPESPVHLITVISLSCRFAAPGIMKMAIIPARRRRPESPMVYRMGEELGCTGHRPSSSLVPPPRGEGEFLRAVSEYFRSRCAARRVIYSCERASNFPLPARAKRSPRS